MKNFLVSVILGVLCFAAYVRYLEMRTVFHPSRRLEVTPRQSGLDFEDVYFKREKNRQLYDEVVDYIEVHYHKEKETNFSYIYQLN